MAEGMEVGPGQARREPIGVLAVEDVAPCLILTAAWHVMW